MRILHYLGFTPVKEFPVSIRDSDFFRHLAFGSRHSSSGTLGKTCKKARQYCASLLWFHEQLAFIHNENVSVSSHNSTAGLAFSRCLNRRQEYVR